LKGQWKAKRAVGDNYFTSYSRNLNLHHANSLSTFEPERLIFDGALKLKESL
jgi:hypothetical protein